MKKHLTISLIVLSWSIAFTGWATAAEPAPAARSFPARAAPLPENKEQLERRLAAMAILVEKSSAAKQIEASAIPQAMALRVKARELRQQADDTIKAGNYVKASALLDQVAKTMLESVRLAAPEQVTGKKKQRDFDNRMESVKTLLAAQQRISAEKRLGTKGTETSDTIAAKLRDAAALAAGGKLDEGRMLLDQVYLTTKLAVEGLRHGDTMVRSLHFASKQEQYRYELDRNDTHKMLIKVLLEKKRASNATLDNSAIQRHLQLATDSRKNAEAAATKLDFESGIRLLEDSTKQLVAAIRSAGVFVPG